MTDLPPKLTTPETPRRVQRRRTRGWKMPPNTVSVTRPGPFGNHYRVERLSGPRSERGEEWIVVNTRTDAWAFPYTFPSKAIAAKHAVDCFESDISEAQRAEIRSKLRGQNIACFCPVDEDACHGDVLLEIANK